MRSFAETTRSYETWMAERLDLKPGGMEPDRTHWQRFEAGLRRKHARMAENPAAFLRGSFYWWLERWQELPPVIRNAPRLLAVGNVHAENFGVWRDEEGRLAWGINDFDESHELPFTSDLLRLATSLTLATDEPIADELLKSYRKGLKAEGRIFLLESAHAWLRKLAIVPVETSEMWWKLFADATDTAAIDIEAAELLRQRLPRNAQLDKFVYREAGLGSLGRARYVALAEWQGGPLAREAMTLLPSAAHWFAGTYGDPAQAYRAVLRRAWRAHDPTLQLDRRWVIRRLSPEARKLELDEIRNFGRITRFVRAMGAELANVHLGTATSVAALRQYLRAMPRHWLGQATEEMAAAIRDDWRAFRHEVAAQERR